MEGNLTGISAKDATFQTNVPNKIKHQNNIQFLINNT